MFLGVVVSSSFVDCSVGVWNVMHINCVDPRFRVILSTFSIVISTGSLIV